VVYALKYDGWSRIADELAARMSRIPLQHDAALGQRATRCQGGAARRVLVPVPLSARKLKERGYNQSELLARALADRTDSSCAPNLLVRMRDTTSQTRLTPEQRLHNVADAFRVDPVVLARHADALVVIVDDVVTTGATLNACAAALAAAGARAIGFVTFGRAADPRASR
jgi:ComF family protein